MCFTCNNFQNGPIKEIPTFIQTDKITQIRNDFQFITIPLIDNPSRKKWKLMRNNTQAIEMTFVAQVTNTKNFYEYGTWNHERKYNIYNQKIQLARYQLMLDSIDNDPKWKEMINLIIYIEETMKEQFEKDQYEQKVIQWKIFSVINETQLKVVWFLFKEGTGKTKQPINDENDPKGEIQKELSKGTLCDYTGLPIICQYQSPIKSMNTKEIIRQEIRKGDHIVVNMILEPFVYYEEDKIYYGIWPIMTFIGKIHKTIWVPFCSEFQETKVNPILYGNYKKGYWNVD